MTEEKVGGQSVLTFNPEESLLRGKIPLHIFEETLKNQDETKIQRIMFSRNGYCNDAVLKLVQKHKKNDYTSLLEIVLDGCFLISDAGIKWLSDIINGANRLEKIILNGCTNLADNELYLLARHIGPSCEISMKGTSVRYITDLEMNRVKVDGCPLSRPENPETIKRGHVFVVPHKSMESSFCHHLLGQKNKRIPFYQFKDYQNLSSPETDWKIQFTEIDLDHPLFMPLSSSRPVQVVIPFDDSCDPSDVKKHVRDTVLRIVSQEPFIGDYILTKKKLEGESGAPVLYGTAEISLNSLAYKQNVHRPMLPILNSEGAKIGQLECTVVYVDDKNQPIKEMEALKNTKYLLNQEVKIQVKVNYANGLPHDIKSSFCKYKFQNIFHYAMKTEEVEGQNPYYKHERTFFVRSVTSKMIKGFQESPLVFEIWGRKKIDESELAQMEKPPVNAESESEYRGCEFVVVDTGKSEKLDKIKLTASDFEETLMELDNSIKHLESHFSDLDVHDQDVYATMCKTKEKILDFCQQLDRVHYMALDVSAEQGVTAVKKKLYEILDRHQLHHHDGIYNIPYRVKRHLGAVKNLITVLDFTSGVFQPEGKEINLQIPGNEILELAKILHQQGEIAILPLATKLVFVDVGILVDIYNKLYDTKTMESCDKRSTAIGQSSKVWTSETVAKHLLLRKGKKKSELPEDLLMEVLTDYLGLIQVPAIRYKEEDTQTLYTLMNTLEPPEISLKEFWKLETPKDFVILRKQYSFIHSVHHTMLSGILSSATQYGRTILLSKEGAVYQLGCVQTAVVMETDQSGNVSLCLESRCYIPEQRSEPINDETVKNVTEYTWHIFCIYSDIINKICKQTRTVYTVMSHVPPGLVNTSVGCRHYWMPNPVRSGTTICTLCNKCTDKGPKCSFNGIMGTYLRECPCKTKIQGCFRCGICIRCVERLWNIRSYLRPMPACPNIEREPKKNKKVEKEMEEETIETPAVKGETDEAEVNPFQELALSGNLFDDGQNEEQEIEPKFFCQLPLDPIANNEFEIQHIAHGHMAVVLFETSTSVRMLVYPGQAMTFADEDMKDEDIREKISEHSSQIMSYKHKFHPGDSMKVRITDPFRAVSKIHTSSTEEKKESKVVYHAAVWKGAMVSHETGLLCFEADNSKGSNKCYFIGTRPFSPEFKSFSMKIINDGQLRYIGLGVSADKSFKLAGQKGRDIRQADFIKYYMNRGGIYSAKGQLSNEDPANVGDILSVTCDVETKKLAFLKNGVQLFETDIKIPVGGYYPQITMHSEGECVQLLEKDPWMPDPTMVKDFGKPNAFDIYRYSNMWISPARTIKLSTIKVKKGDRYERHYSGWLLLHNPTDMQMLYSVQPNNYFKQPRGCISPGESLPLLLNYQIFSKGLTPLDKGVKVVWTEAGESKTWTDEEIQEVFDTSSHNAVGVHRLNCVGKTSYTSDSDVPLFNEAEDTGGDEFKMEIFKNMERVAVYLLKKGKYIASVYSLFKNKEPEYILKRPKSPSFWYADNLQKRYSLIVKLDEGHKKMFAEAVITNKEEDGYNLEFTPTLYSGKKNKKEVIFCEGDSVGISDEEWRMYQSMATENDVYKYVDRYVEGTFLLDPFLPAPPYLITKGSTKMLDICKPRWQRQVLTTMCSCIQVNSHITMQEENIAQHSKELLKWIKYKNGTRPVDSVVFLPAILDSMTLTFPQVSRIFSDVSLHRLCFVHEKFLDSSLRMMADERFGKINPQQRPRVRSFYSVNKKYHINLNDGKMEIPLNLSEPKEATPHFLDIPAFPVKEEVPLDLSYGCHHQSWTYVALLANKLLMPSYKNIINGKTENLNREQIESHLYQLLQTYASLCSIYALQHGGLSNQPNPDNYSRELKRLMKDHPIPKNRDNNMMKDDNAFRNVSKYFLVCKAHDNQLFGQNLILHQEKFSLDEEYYTPYSEHLNTLLIEGVNLSSLPKNVFETFKNIQALSLMDVPLDKMSVFPSGLSSCRFLEIFCLSGLKTITDVPKDVFHGPALRYVFFNNMPMKSLDIDWPISSLLTSLILTGLLIEKVPVGIGYLSNLEILILDNNPITTLPDELENLTQLKILSLRGIPWIELKGETEVSLVNYQQWHQQNPFIMNYLSKEKTDALFEEFDSNHTAILSATELAKYNMHVILNVPRIGSDKLDDRRYGGLPPVVYKLKSLMKLDLSYTAITMISEHAKVWENLISLKVDHCPLLESVDGQVGLLPNLHSIRMSNCPSLETPPQDIVGRGSGAVKAFLKRISGGYTECHRTKLMFIGLGQAGKTTLLEALRNPEKKTSGSQDPELTDGIDIIPWVVPIEHNGRKIEITYSCWDFAGQTVYYNTHQFFLSKQAVYMLLWNMRMGFEHAGLDFWLSSVACHCPEAPVIIVGTQLDQIPMPDIPEDDLMEKYPQIKKFCYVSSTQGTNIPELEQTLINVTMNHCTQMSMKIPKVWLSFENGILKNRSASTNIMNWKQLTHCAIDNGLYEERDIRLAVEFLNDLGTVQYFDTEFLRDRVVINPQWIVDVMAKVVSVNEKSIKEHQGRFYHRFIKEIWKDYDPSLHQWMLKLTETFDLTFPLPDEVEKINIVPCLLPESKPHNLPWPYLSEDEGYRESTILYKFTYLPTGLFNRAQARLFSQGFTEHSLLEFIWKKGSILKKNQHYALVRQLNDYQMEVSVQGPRPKNVLDLIHETLSTLISDAFDGVHYDYYIQCPDCVEKEGTKEPFLFKAELISRAHSVNAPFLQCTKFFHTVSIGELLRIMPDSKDTEFDAQMQESISTLEEISRNMAKDVAILYAPGDLPQTPLPPNHTPEQAEQATVDVRMIHEDLKKAGISCWFSDNMDKVSDMEMIMALKNSKVLVVCISEEFVQNEKCHQWFLYATEQLHQPFAIAVMSGKLGWQQTDIGFKIGNPKMAMIKNMKRYPKKIMDLIDIIRDQLENLEKMKQETPSVFISYCWANSHEACSVTTEAKSGSLGYGDPRVIKKHLEQNGIRCWMDYEQMGKFGLYQDITVGLQNSKVLVICVSDEYLDSDACMMEARFGIHNMYLPMVVCVVGTGKLWKESEISLMIKKQNDLATVIKMQYDYPNANLYERVLTAVRHYLERPETEKQRKIREKLERARSKKKVQEGAESKIKQQGDTQFSFQEEIELVQRKFMRFTTKLSQADEIIMPRLLVIDFHDKLHRKASKSFLLDYFKDTDPDYARRLIEAIDEADAGKKEKAKAEAEAILKQIAVQLSMERIRRKESKLSQYGGEESLRRKESRLSHYEGEDRIQRKESGLAQADTDDSLQKRESLMPMFEEERSESQMSSRGQSSEIDRVEKGKLYRSILNILEDCVDDEWKEKDLSLRVLCEFDEGWHFYGATVDLDQITRNESLMKIVRDSAPYLARVYAILKQSGVDLNCSTTQKGENFLNFIRKEGSTNKAFSDSYRVLRRVIEVFTESDDSWMYMFPRCILPNGKTVFLCEEHMQKMSATKIPYDSGSAGPNRILLTEQDRYLKEVLLENMDLLKIRREKSTLNKESLQIEKEKTEVPKNNLKTIEKQVSVNEAKGIREKTMDDKEDTRSTTSQQSMTSNASTTTSKSSKKHSQRQTSQACCIQ